MLHIAPLTLSCVNRLYIKNRSDITFSALGGVQSDKNFEMLDGSEIHQRMILSEQSRRLERLVGQVDFIVTDAPTLLKQLTAFPSYSHEELVKSARETLVGAMKEYDEADKAVAIAEEKLNNAVQEYDEVKDENGQISDISVDK